MIIDIHSHEFPDGIAIRAMRGMCAKTAGRLWPIGDGTLANHLDHMDNAGVDLAVSCPIATKPGMFEGILRRAQQLRDGELGERARKKIIPFASVHPLDPKVIEHLVVIANAGIKGVKFHSFFQEFSLADPNVWPMFRKIAELGLVVECHCGEDVGWPNALGLCGPDEVATLLENVDGLKFVALHLGGCDGYPVHATDRLMELGCYIDTSALHRHWFHDEPMRVLRSWPTDRILFGTDFPWEHYPEAIAWVQSVRESSDLQMLFGGNAARLLGL